MLDAMLIMLKFLLYITIAGIPVVAVVILIKNNVKFKPVTIEILKAIGGVIFIALLIYLSIKG
jgi:hypothetical protein